MTHISAKRRQQAATVHTKDGQNKFPVDSVQTAKSAAHLLNTAKPPLSSSQRATVIRKVHKYVPGAQAPTSPSPSSKGKK